MLLRRATPLLALALAALACEPPVPFDPAGNNPAFVDDAVFDPQPDATDQSPASIPLPNDLALQDSAIATQPAAQAELLKSFQAQGGFPADQELPITFDFVRVNIDPATGAVTRTAPPLDVTSINPSNLIILSLSAAGVGPVAYDAPTAASYVVVPDDRTNPTGNQHGTLIIKKKADASGLREFAPAVYVAAVKGGPSGVQLVGGGNVNQRPTQYLITQGVDLNRPENQGLIPGATRAAKAASAAQLEQLRKAYLLPFAALQSAGFATTDIAALTAFTITSAVRVFADPVAAAKGVSGALPFPSDFLLDPVTHRLIPAAQDPVKGPFGPLGPALGTLDGFSTTGIITATMSGLIDPTTVNKDTVFVYELLPTGSVVRVPEARELASGAKPGFVAVSSQLVAAGTSATNVVGLQPAVPFPLPTGGAYALPPLHEGSVYAVVLTDGIKEPGGKKTAQATLGRLLALSSPLLVGTTPTVAGLALSDAKQLEPLRLALSPVLDDLAATKNITRSSVTLAYTISTQSGIKSTAGKLSALPYGTGVGTLAPLAKPTVSCSAGLVAANPPVCGAAPLLADTLSQYGVDPTVVPNADIGYLVEAVVPMFSKLRCPTAPDLTAAACAAYLKAVNGGKDTGAFLPADFNPKGEGVTAVISVPLPPYGALNCVPSATNLCTLPLVIYRHGVGDSKRDMLFVANQLNKAGFVVAAIDAAKEGDRSFCNAALPNQCAAGATCVPDPEFTGEGDAPLPSPGRCVSGGAPADFARDVTTCPLCTNEKSTALASSNFLVSFNLFRTRDTLRQDIIDQSQLIRLLSPNPACDVTKPPTDPRTCANKLITATTGVQIDPKQISFLGQSLGAIQGVVDVAANPRVSKVALNVGGGTITDVFSDPDSSNYPNLNYLLSLRKLDKARNPAGFLQFLTVAKWIVDPADPINFAQSLTTNTIPFGSAQLNALVPAPATRPTIGQMALCDGNVRNPWNIELYKNIGLGPVTASTGTFTTFVAKGGASCPANAVDHGFLLEWGVYGTNPATSITLQAQDDISAFFSSGTLPPNLRSAP